MTQLKENLIEKRKNALAKLQGNRGKDRLVTENRQAVKAEGINLLVKEYREHSPSAKEKKENLDSSLAQGEIQDVQLENLPKIAKATGKIKKKKEQTTEAVERVKETRQKLKKIREAKQQQQDESELETKNIQDQVRQPVNRHQLKQDLLNADFWQQASQWLSGINTDIHLSSTPPEEIELLHKQAKHRYKALKLMLDDTQKELDAFEAYFRNIQSFSTAKNISE